MGAQALRAPAADFPGPWNRDRRRLESAPARRLAGRAGRFLAGRRIGHRTVEFGAATLADTHIIIAIMLGNRASLADQTENYNSIGPIMRSIDLKSNFLEPP